MKSLLWKHIWLVARREYLERVRTKAFLVMTLLMPVMMFGFAVVPSLLSMKKRTGVVHIAVVAADPRLGEAVRNELTKTSAPAATSTPAPVASAAPPRDPMQDRPARFAVDTSTALTDAEHSRLQTQINNKSIDGFVWLSDDAVASGSFVYTGRETSDFIEMGQIERAVSRAVTSQKLQQHGIAAGEIEQLIRRMDMQPVTWKDGKAVKSNALAQLLSSILLVVTLYVSVLMHGMNVMRAVLEEKTSRIMEVLMSCVTTSELLAGKIVGVGAVGITQILIWFGLAALIGSSSVVSSGGAINFSQFSLWGALAFGAFFLLGFTLYSTMFAAVGAMVNSEQEAQQLQFFVVLPLVVSVIMMMMVIRTPNDPVVVAMSLVPFCSPILMYLRIVVQTPPLWQIVASLALLVGSIFFMLAVCSRIYRVGVLMYGKRPTLPEILKWLRYA